VAAEISASLSTSFSGTTSFEITNTQEFTRKIKLADNASNKRKKSITYYVYLSLWKHTWDIYLQSIEEIELKYQQRPWSLKKTRDNITNSFTHVGRPLGRLIFYEPQDTSMEVRKYRPEVTNADEVSFDILHDPCPKIFPSPLLQPTIVRKAFPETKEDRLLSVEDAIDLLQAYGFEKTGKSAFQLGDHRFRSTEQALRFLEEPSQASKYVAVPKYPAKVKKILRNYGFLKMKKEKKRSPKSPPSPRRRLISRLGASSDLNKAVSAMIKSFLSTSTHCSLKRATISANINSPRVQEVSKGTNRRKTPSVRIRGPRTRRSS
jgi:hypothetical protein